MFFLPWPAIGGALKRAWRRPGFVVVYDGSCGLCRRTMAVLRAVDVFECLEIHDAVADWDVLHRRFPHLSPDACLRDMHVLICDDGRVRVGYAGYRALAAGLPLAWVVLPFLYLPGARLIGDRIYRRVAARRHAEGCALPATSSTSA
jgi:predicted DCC family thiol-disulfide oxidoreductase YuxK